MKPGETRQENSFSERRPLVLSVVGCELPAPMEGIFRGLRLMTKYQ